MGCIESNVPPVDPISEAIDKQIREERKEIFSSNTNRLLLLGCGESGKSTFVKQMRRIYNDNFSDDEVKNYKLVVHENIVYSIQNLIQAANDNQLSFKEENIPKTEALIDVEFDAFNEEMGDMIQDVYNDPAIRTAMEEYYMKYHVLDSAKYFFDALDRIKKDDYVPTEEDIVFARKKTSGLQETRLEVGDGERLVIVDVGGQRSERRKWAMCFVDVTCLIYFAAISEYDMVLSESIYTNRMDEAIKVFSDICNLMIFKHMPFILFLNKMDLFKQKKWKKKLILRRLFLTMMDLVKKRNVINIFQVILKIYV